MEVITKTVLELNETEVRILRNFAEMMAADKDWDKQENTFAKNLLENLPSDAGDWS